MKPGTTITVTTASTPRSAPTDSGVAFWAGLMDSGPADRPIQILSLDQFNTQCGGRVSYSELYDDVETFFRVGGSVLYLARQVGPAAAKATKNLLDNAAGISLVATAVGPGAYYNALKIQVTAGVVSGYQIHILDANNNLLENSGDLVDQASAVAWSQGSNYFRLALGASALVPTVAAAASPAGGADDRNNITDAQRAAALALFTADLGPGQVAEPGNTTDTAHQRLTAHAAAFNRRAILDLPDSGTLSATLATVTTSASNGKVGGFGQYAAAFWPRIAVPGPITAPTVNRTVAPSAYVCGRIAAVDASEGADTPAAGVLGQHGWPTGVSEPTPDDTSWGTAYAAGVNVIYADNGTVTIFGWRSLADPINNQLWLNFGVSRYIMSLVARLRAVASPFDFSKIDGKGKDATALAGALTAVCSQDYADDNLYGETEAEAYSVQVGAPVNTDATAQAGQLNAQVQVRPSPMAETVNINIINTPVTQEVQ